MAKQFSLQLRTGKKYPYQVVHSSRAKHIRIKLSHQGELSVVLPRRTSISHAHDFIEKKRDWIEKHLKNTVIVPADLIPNVLNLKLLNELWQLELNADNAVGIKLVEKPDYRLIVSGNIKETALIKKGINKWCQKKAKEVFPQMLELQAEKHGFHFNRLSIRTQKTRWGSCSMNKNISLNAKLLFMPENIARYVMIHELCHTIEMNHSQRFWMLVEDCDPDYLENRKQLKIQGKAVFL